MFLTPNQHPSPLIIVLSTEVRLSSSESTQKFSLIYCDINFMDIYFLSVQILF